MKRTFALWLLLGACGGTETPVEPAIPPCDPNPVSRTDAFAAARLPDSEAVALAELVASRYASDHAPTEMGWDWGEGVLQLSMVDLYRVTANPAHRDFYRAWMDHHVGRGYRQHLTSSDRCPPALTALALYDETCELPYRGVVTDTLTYLYDESLRTADGGINHLGTNDLFGVSLWLDSLFMFGNVLTRWGEREDDARALDELASQYTIFLGHLQDSSGWLTHAYDWPLAQQEAGVFWARGNAWVTAASYEYLRVRQSRGETDALVEQAIAAQVDAILAAQDADTGLWWTVVNQPGTSYLETSASALFAVGLARGYRYGFLDDSVLPAIESAMEGVRSRIDAEGVVSGISGPTMVGDAAYYASIEVDDQIHYGVGAVILALIETSGLE